MAADTLTTAGPGGDLLRAPASSRRALLAGATGLPLVASAAGAASGAEACTEAEPVTADAELVRMAAEMVANQAEARRLCDPYCDEVSVRYLPEVQARLAKVEIPELLLPDGTTVQVEALGDGQQFVAYRPHPRTRAPYTSAIAAPHTHAFAEVLEVAPQQALAATVKAAGDSLRPAGGKEPPKEEKRSAGSAAGSAKVGPKVDIGNDFFREVNRRALDGCDRWVKALFPSAGWQTNNTTAPGMRRVSSADLGRGYQEDLSIHPREGLHDFGPRSGVTAIDAVMEFGGSPYAKAAAHWLREKLGVAPEDRGWHGARKAAGQDRGTDGTGWLQRCQTDRGGNPRPNVANARLALREDPQLADVVAHDNMLRAPLLVKPVPGSRCRAIEALRPVMEADVTAVQDYLQLAGPERLGKDTVHQTVDPRAWERAFHPVRDYLASLTWDGTPRLETWLHSDLGADEGDCASGIDAMFMVAMMARVFRSGCKADYMPVLEGPQGALKSIASAILVGRWFSDPSPDVCGSGKDVWQYLNGEGLIETAEMSALDKAEAALLKAPITRAEARYRPPYGRKEVVEPRQCVFVGTMNKAVYLRDGTGGRRFWPARVGAINVEALARDRGQLSAEAVRPFRRGARWWPEKDFEAKHIRPEQDTWYEAEAWEQASVERPDGWRTDSRPEKLPVTTLTAARKAPFIDTPKLGTADQRRITTAMERLGWVRGNRTAHARAWVPSAGPKQVAV